MKLYDAVCGNEEFRENLPGIIDDLIENQEGARQRLRTEASLRGDSLVAHASRILASLSEKGSMAILTQLRSGNANVIINEPIEALIFQAIASDRWSKEYGESTFDLVLALPECSKVIAISTTETEIPMDPIIPRLAKVRLENVHLYSFFNRAHAVKGRRVSSAEENQHKAVDLKRFEPFMRTCGDIETIGKGMALPFFTPFFTIEGLRLGFFFTLVCKVDSVNWVRSPTGFGVTPDQVDLTLRDSSGCLKARMNTEIFAESLVNPVQRTDVKLRDPMDLISFGGEILIVGVWILGRGYPEVAFLGLPKDGSGIDVWGVLSFMNSHRKLSLSELSGVLSESYVEKACRETNCILKTKDWIYYKEESWPTEIFLAMEENGFPYELKFPDVLKFGASFWTFKAWTNRILRFLRINPHILELYRSKEPLNVYKKIHELPEKEKEAASKFTPKTEERIKLVPFASRNRPEILNISRNLSTLGYTAWDLFSPEWDNGGYALERKWLHVRWRQKQVILDEMTSALFFILTMRGEVKIPREAAMGSD